MPEWRYELHAAGCDSDEETLATSISQLEQTEDHVRRLMLVAAGKQDKDHPAEVLQCIDDIRASLDAAAKTFACEPGMAT